MDTCTPEGRDCIEAKSTSMFNCSTTCDGVYANVQWDGRKSGVNEEDHLENVIETNMIGNASAETGTLLRRLAHLEKKVKFLEGTLEEKREELDKDKYQLLVFEYRKCKTRSVKHFRLDPSANSRSFGKSE